MAKNPAQFDVIVTTNLAGDIISDLASGLVGGLGFAASGNYGDEVAIFEAVHGSAPKYAGKNVINPTALILSSVMMLRHLGETAAAQRVEDAVFVTLEEGKAVTLDVARQAGDVEEATSTSGYTDAIIANLGRAPPTRYPAKAGARRRAAPEPRPALGDGGCARHRRRVSSASTSTSSRTISTRPSSGRSLDGAGRPRLPPRAHLDPRHRGLPGRRAPRIDNVGWWRCRFVAAERGRRASTTPPSLAPARRVGRHALDLGAGPEAAPVRRRGGLHPRPGPVAGRWSRRRLWTTFRARRHAGARSTGATDPARRAWSSPGAAAGPGDTTDAAPGPLHLPLDRRPRLRRRGHHSARAGHAGVVAARQAAGAHRRRSPARRDGRRDRAHLAIGLGMAPGRAGRALFRLVWAACSRALAAGADRCSPCWWPRAWLAARPGASTPDARFTDGAPAWLEPTRATARVAAAD